MSKSLFRIEKHVLPCQHIRTYPHATVNEQEEQLQFVINQYSPHDNPNPRSGDVTILAAHANGVGKELYEPLWDDLYKRAQQRGVRIRAIWMADVSFQGESYVLNEGKIANDPSWFDHPRDLLLLVNHFRSQMPRPIIGVGHSMGGNNVTNLALMHPRLLDSLILIDPVILSHFIKDANYMPAYMSTFRRDVWPSREAASTSFLKNKFYQSWDRRVFDLWIEHGLRELPTAIHSTYESKNPSDPHSSTDKPVTLTTPKQQEVFTFLRGKFPKPGTAVEGYTPPYKTHPDIPPVEFAHQPFYRSEPVVTWTNLPFLRPRCLYVFADGSPMSIAPGAREDRVNHTGIGVGGSGGVKAGAVRDVWIKDAGHFVPFEKPGKTADVMIDWMAEEQARWQKHEVPELEAWAKVPVQEKINFSDDYVYWIEKTYAPPGKGKERSTKGKL